MSTTDPLAPWRTDVVVRPVLASADHHSIHAYFNVCPESPDGRFVLFHASTTADAHHGELRIVERSTGIERTLAGDIGAEDAHRVAAQQWLSNGRRVAFQNERGGRWMSVVVDLESNQQRVIGPDRLTGWGQPTADLLPLYGPHWQPGEHRDLQIANVATGDMQTVVTADAVREAYPDWCRQTFPDKPLSIFFPILSPDLSRVIIKMSAPASGRVRTVDASIRDGLIVYSLAERRFLSLIKPWGHPFWRADSRTILQSSNFITDTETGDRHQIPGLPDFGSPGHPAANPAGTLFVTDTRMDRLGGNPADWGIVLCDLRGGEYVLLHRFNNAGGARSWRVSHPHPVFSRDGRRIYFNVSDGPWTRLHVAEGNECP